MLVINPDVCIDCGVCERECPVNAISSDRDPDVGAWALLNRRCSKKWPSITMAKSHPPDANEWASVKEKRYLLKEWTEEKLD